jgi:hypothetical protein
MSPVQPELTIKLSSAGALLYIKLWKNMPSDTAQAADMSFVIETL